MFRAAIALAAALFAGTASAATVTVADLGPANATPIAFANADAVTGTVFQSVTGSVSGIRRSPWEGTGFLGSGVYTSVSANSAATYDFGPSLSLSLVWGSPDAYNRLSFFSGATLLGTITGQQVTTEVKPLSTLPNSSPSQGFAFVELALAGGLAFDRVTFESIGSNAFEYGSVSATPVPLPAAGWMLLAALGGLGFLRRRAA